jgi:hypothetical protein
MSETQAEIDEREQYEPDLESEECLDEYEPEWVKKLKLNLRYAYWRIRAEFSELWDWIRLLVKY